MRSKIEVGESGIFFLYDESARRSTKTVSVNAVLLKSPLGFDAV
jgi:hypothetical protein